MASRLTGPPGMALPKTVQMSSKPCSAAASMNAASMVFVPRKRRGISSPCAIPCLANSSIVVGIFEKVLVSCENVPVTMRMLSAFRRSIGSRLWFKSTHLSHKFIRTHPLGKPIADRHDTDVGGLILLSDGLQTGFHLLRIAIDIRVAKFGDIG